MTLGRASLLLLAIPLIACSGLTKLDYSKLASRAGWQHPDRVIESLEIRPGSRVWTASRRSTRQRRMRTMFSMAKVPISAMVA